MQRIEREAARRKDLENLLDRLRSGIAIVEGLHDVKAFAALGVKAVNLDALRLKREELPVDKPVFIMMDGDRGGKAKERKAIDTIAELYPGLQASTYEKKQLLQLLNITTIEEVSKASRVLRKER
ncbi:MAG: toprim domain-containing protein [Candidatus Marsarchaeota archaeon]|jgi:hypothetical protein|nr:toprim domain-containing protein [Candidatus Marsarchaeota archaeon]MCL5419041.1 toprim domain-containing protein [Candidatus Marsarchaeota archaeon]